MNQKQNILILGSGVLYAAFFQFLPLLPTPFLPIAFFLPVFFYAAAFLGGVGSVVCAILPHLIVLLINQQSLSELIFSFLFSMLTPLLLGYVVDKRNLNSLKSKIYPKWTIHHGLIFVVSIQILTLFTAFIMFDFSGLIEENFLKIQHALNGQLSLQSEKIWPQLVFSISTAYNLLNIFYACLAKKIIEKIKNTHFIYHYDKHLDLRADLPFLFFLAIYLGLSIWGVDVFYKAVALSFTCLSVWPVILVGIFSFKKIGHKFGLKSQTLNFILFLLFFLVQLMIIIVLLGLMECSCNISRLVRQKKD